VTIVTEKGEKSALALKRINDLIQRGNEQNRVPMVCSGKYDLLAPLAECLVRESENERLLACLALNNLSIPTENKRVMTAGPSSKAILAGLCKAIAEDKPEAYLCCICLMNLSFLGTSLTAILQYCPRHGGAGGENAIMMDPLENPNSFLRVLEKLLSKNSVSIPTSHGAIRSAWGWPLSKARSDERSALMMGNSPVQLPANNNAIARFFENILTPMPLNAVKTKPDCIRWACGLIKNLAKSKENAALLGRTTIPSSIVDIIRAAAPVSKWTSNSLEDFSLFIVLHLAQWPISREALLDAGAVQVVKPIMIMTGDPDKNKNVLGGDVCGLQSLKATMACALLGAEWTDFPDGAAESVVELMSNIMEKRAKEGQYACGAFQRSTATQAFRDLARAAVKADCGDGECTNKVMTGIDVCLQIISDVVVVDADVGGSSHHDYDPDDPDKELVWWVSAEYAVGAIHAMLPSLLLLLRQLRCEPSGDDIIVAQRLQTLGSVMSRVVASSSSSFIEETKSMAKEIADIMVLTRPAGTSDVDASSAPVLGNHFWNQYRNQSSSRPILPRGVIV
jgi:hypothetical protein